MINGRRRGGGKGKRLFVLRGNEDELTSPGVGGWEEGGDRSFAWEDGHEREIKYEDFLC